MDRRLFLASSAASVPLASCVTARPPLARNACLAPVDVSPSRVIRTVAGLRPYRASGFVVRAEPLGAKTLVHNYGHGGAGITLSWGSSRLATQLGLPGHRGPVAVLGAGVMGLSTARLAQEAGYAVTIHTKALPPDTTSNIAGGQISPFGHYREDSVTAAWRAQFAAAMDYSWRRFQIMLGDDYGIRWLPTYEQSDEVEAAPFASYHVDSRLLTRSEHPFPAEPMRRFVTMYVEVGRYLRQLTRDFLGAGGRIEVREFASPGELATLPETLVFNCTGLGSRALFGDEELRPVRGQLAILLPQPEVDYAYLGEAGYMFPRADGIVLGGSFEYDKWEAAPQPERIARILESHRAFNAGLRCTA
ncbi:MAG TPA: FAD-dependent oxidoreductase [Novosphingobium sp.]|nr:FAD-dependent oxidoreductase [Novosphingobium sp.]